MKKLVFILLAGFTLLISSYIPQSYAAAPVFIDQGDGTIADIANNLVWLKKADCFPKQTWDAAMSSAFALGNGQCGLADGSTAGDWRLAKIEELNSLIVGRFEASDLNAKGFASVLADTYWSSTDYFNGSAGAADMGVGFAGNISKTNLYYGWPVRYLKKNPVLVDRGNGIIADTANNLLWLKNANCFGTKDWNSAKTSAGTLGSGQCGLTDGSVAGDWHLPTIDELTIFTDFNLLSTQLNTSGFANVQSSGYWSSDNYSSATSAALNDMSVGFAGNASITNPYYVWPVRYLYKNPVLENRGDGTIVDTANNLVWLKNANCFGAQNWGAAYSSANNLASGQCGLTDGSTSSDWHLPTMEELTIFTDFNLFATNLNTAGFSNVQSNVYWSSTKVTDTSAAVDDMTNGFLGNTSTSNSYFAWPVRYPAIPARLPAATTGTVLAISTNGATLNGTVTANGASTTVTFEYGLTAGYGTTATAAQSPLVHTASNTPVSAAITGLACNTTYHFRVKGVNGAGIESGSDGSFTTATCPIIPAVTTEDATTISSTGATLNGTVTSNGASTTVTIDYGLTDSYGSTATAPQSPLASNAGNVPVSAVITGLFCSTTYHFRVKGVNSAGITSGFDATFTTSNCPAPGNIFTVAGGGVGDNGAATAAILYAPSGVAVDSAGNLYITDLSNNSIRKVAAGSGIITTVAGNGTTGFAGDGGAATSASLYYPYGVAVDSAGNLYIADSFNNRIRKVAAGSGIITTVAGNGTTGFAGDGGASTSARLSYPYGVAVDSAGNLYIADTGNNRIRKVDAVNGIITTVAGNGTDDFAGDGGASTSASLYQPRGVAVDSSGNLYIADYYNNRIRKVDAGSGIIITVAGNGAETFGGDGGAATSANLYNPSGVAVDSSGNLYIADYYNNRIRKVDAGSGIITTVAGNGTATFGGDGGAATSANLSYPNGVAVDSSGNLYVAESRIRKISAGTGIITTVAGNGTYRGDGGAATSASLNDPNGVTVDSAGNLYIVDYKNNRIRKVDAGTGIITTVAGNGTYGGDGDGGAATSASLNAPNGVTVDSAGNLYIADYYNNRIRKVAAWSGIITTVAGNGTSNFAGDGGAATSASLYQPSGVAVDSAGNLYIADRVNHRIRKVAAGTGVITTVAGNGTPGFAGDGGDGGVATSASLYYPSGVAVDSAGNLYIADKFNHRIRKVAAGTGIITSVAGNGTPVFAGDGGAATSASLRFPNGVTVDSSGNLYVADTENNRIRKISAGTGIITTVIGNGAYGFAGDNVAAASASLRFPNGVTVDSVGNLYIADTANDRIRMVVSQSVVENPPSNIEVQLPTTNSNLVITWTKPAFAGFSHIHIYRSTLSGTLGTLIADNQTGIKYIDTGLASQTKFYYTVRGVDNIGNESNNTAQVSGTTLDATAPSVPGNQTAVFTGPATAITITWTKPADADFSHVHIYRSTSNGQLGTLAYDNVTATSKIDGGLTNGVTYYYTIRAVDKLGNETTNINQVSAQVSVATSGDITFVITNLVITKPATGEALTLNWTNPTGLSKLELYRSNISGEQGTLVCIGTETTFTDTGLVPRSTYYYTFVLYNAQNQITTMSQQDAYPDETNPPLPVTGLRATLKDTAKVKLDWLRSPSKDTIAYDILWDNGDGNKLPEEFIAVANINNPNTQTWTSDSLTSGVTYRFAVKSVDDTIRTSSVFVGVTPVDSVNSLVSAMVTSPAAGAKVYGNSVTLTAGMAAGESSDASEVQFKYRRKGTLPWNVIGSADTSAPFSTNWNVTALAEGDGDYELIAIATAKASSIVDPNPSVTIVVRTASDATITENNDGTVQTATVPVYTTAPATLTTQTPAGAAKVSLPSGAVTSDTQVTVSVPSPATVNQIVPAGYVNTSLYIDVSFGNNQHVIGGSEPATIEIPYLDANDDNITDDTALNVYDMRIFDYNGTSWKELPTFVDKTRKIIYAATSNFSLFAALVPPSITFTSGYNMVSVPLTPASATPSSVFGAYTLIYDPVSQAFVKPAIIQPGKGYFVWSGSNRTLTPLGTETVTPTFSIPIKKGWNMIGNPYKGKVAIQSLTLNCGTPKSITQSELDGEIAGTFFHAINGAYELATTQNAADTIDPWKGYWLLSDRNCDLIFTKP